MPKNFPKIPLLLSTLFFIITCSMFFYFYRELSNNNAKLQKEEEAWQTETIRRQEIKTLDASVKSIATERADLATHFADSSNIVPFLNTISTLAKTVGTRAQVSTVNILDDGSGLLVGVSVSGTFPNLYKFVLLLENSPYELEFLGMDLKKGSSGSTADAASVDTQWTMNLSLKLLSFIK